MPFWSASAKGGEPSDVFGLATSRAIGPRCAGSTCGFTLGRGFGASSAAGSESGSVTMCNESLCLDGFQSPLCCARDCCVDTAATTIAIAVVKQPSRCAKAFDMAISVEKFLVDDAKNIAFTGRRLAQNFSLRSLGKDFEAEERRSF